MKKSFIAHRREKDGEEQSLWTLLFEVSQIAGQHAEKIDLKEFGEILGLVHDLGKASKEFDHYIRSNLGLIDLDSDE